MFDIFTVLVTLCVVPVLLGLQFLYFWSRDRGSRWLGWLVAPFILAAMSVALLTARGAIGDFLSIGISNALLIAAFGLAWQATRVFEGRRILYWPTIVAMGVWLALSTQPFFLSDLPLRVIVSSAIVGGFGLACAHELWRGRDEDLPSRMPAVLVLTSYSLLTLARIPLAHVVPFPLGGLPMHPGWLAAGTLLSVAHMSFLTLLIVSMSKERHESKQRTDALSDPLTGLLNRRAFSLHVLRGGQRGRYDQSVFSLLVLDLDRFKSINDRFGHDVGDKVLTKFAEVAERTVRPTDQIFRMGGEEFCCLLPGASQAEALGVAERLRKTFEAVEFIVDGELLRSTVSIGLASAAASEADLDTLQAAADAAVYEAKARGRNRVVAADASLRRRPLRLAGAHERAT